MLLENSAIGVPLAHERLARDLGQFETIAEQTDSLLALAWRTEIGSTPPGEWTPAEIAEQLQAAGYELPKTSTGRASTSQESLGSVLPRGRVKSLLSYRSALQKTLSTYLRPWAEHGTHLHCSWQQVRSYGDVGARTGRMSSSPNLQNITSVARYDALRAEMVEVGAWHEWMRIPNLRSYIEAPPGHSLFAIDYSQQELRMLAHYEEGVLSQAYRDEPELDLHQFTADLIRDRTNVPITRKQAKTINFAKIYGAGRAKLAEQMGVDYDVGCLLVEAYEVALPSIKGLQWELQDRGRSGGYITTLGGRRYYAEPDREYKLLNYLIQGSSADQTKEAMRQWYPQIRGTETRFLLAVHDEIVGICPTEHLDREVNRLKRVMQEAMPLDVPVLADATTGTNYGEMK
jgi:DNA polymerase-1